jgi:hypothetical protein
VSDDAHVEEMIDKTVQTFGRLDAAMTAPALSAISVDGGFTMP